VRERFKKVTLSEVRERFEKVTFTSDAASQSAPVVLNGFTYRVKAVRSWLENFSTLPNAENCAKIC